VIILVRVSEPFTPQCRVGKLMSFADASPTQWAVTSLSTGTVSGAADAELQLGEDVVG
jgi:hypothetical protein